MIPGRTPKPEDLLRLVWRQRRLIVAPAVAAAFLGIGVATYLPDRYRSETLILHVPQRVPEAYVRSTATTRIADRLQSISQQMLSRTRLEQVIAALDLYANERREMPLEAVIERMRADIEVQIVRGEAFRVRYVSRDPTMAVKVVERLTSLFIEENLRDRELLAEGTNEFLTSQLDEARRQLVNREKKLEEFRHRYAGELPSQVPTNLQVVQNTQMQVQALVESLSRDRDRRLMLERLLEDAAAAATAPAIVAEVSPSAEAGALAAANASPPSYSRQLEAAAANLAALERRLKPEHPDILRMKRQVDDLRAKADAEALALPTSAPTIASPATDLLEAARQKRLRDLRAEVGSLDRQISQKEKQEQLLRQQAGVYQGRIEASVSRESQLTELMRDYDTIQKSYTTLLGKKEESHVSANLERHEIGEQFKVVDPARLPARPFSPNRPVIALAATLIGAGLGLGLSLILELRDTTLKTDEDAVAALALPVLAMVPLMTSARERRLLWWKRIALSGASVTTLALSIAAIAWLTKAWF